MNTRISLKKSGFTLTETVIAIGVVALLLTSFLAVFGPARNQIQNVVAREEADRLLEALETEMTTLRLNDQTFPNSFAKAFDWTINSHNTNDTIFLYLYRADPNAPLRPDDSMAPVPSESAISGQDAITLPAVRRFNDPLFIQDLEAIQGRIYMVKLTQLVFNNGQLVPGQEGQIIDPNPNGGGGNFTNPANFPEAAITLKADFYVLPSKQASWVTDTFDSARFVRPVFSRNIAIRR